MITQMEPEYGEEEKRVLQSYLDSGGWLTEYTNTREFESKVADYVEATHAHAVNNGTIGLVVALMALDIGQGDEVIVPDLTHVATAYAVNLVGAKPQMVDIDPETLCMDPSELSAEVSRETTAIIHVSLNGRSHRIDEIKSIADENDLYLVEDAAQSLGSYHNDTHLGMVGDIGVFSFSYAKIITTGQGGMIVTDDEEISEQVDMIRDFGRPESGVDDYDILGLNAKFTDLQAVVGIAQMQRLKDRVKFKKELYKMYKQKLENIEEIRFPKTNLEETPPWFVDIIIEDGDREQLSDYLETADIDTRPFYPPVHTQGPYAGRSENIPITEKISKNGIWLPSSPNLTNEEVEYICENIQSFFE